MFYAIIEICNDILINYFWETTLPTKSRVLSKFITGGITNIHLDCDTCIQWWNKSIPLVLLSNHANCPRTTCFTFFCFLVGGRRQENFPESASTAKSIMKKCKSLAPATAISIETTLFSTYSTEFMFNADRARTNKF